MYRPEMIPSGQSPRRELQLQGPRPTPLKLHQSSHKIRKPPVPPQPAPSYRRPPLAPAPPPPPPPRSPVIIYAVSPKIIHTNPNEFMSLVQRLTGPNSYNSPTASSAAAAAVSPAARFASIEKTKSPKLQQAFEGNTEALSGAVEIETDRDLLMTGQFHGILSPNPNTLPPISPNFFPQPTPPENNSLSFFFDLSPVLHSSRNYNYLDNNNNFMLPSPSAAFIISPQINLPSPNTLDLFHSLFDL